MVCKNLNKTLTTEILDNAGFKFDGYYYVNALCPIRLNADGDKFNLSFIDETQPQINQSISTYSELIALLTQTISYAIHTSLGNKSFTDANEQLKAIGDIIKKLFGFDSNLKYVISMGAAGLQVSPDNEYTFTLVNGDIRNFEVSYVLADNPDTINKLELECAAQCISYPFIMTSIIEDTGANADNIEIRSVNLINHDETIPFFGMGIPKFRSVQAPTSESEDVQKS